MTLVESLVAVAIIAVLLAILLPALAAVRRETRFAACLATNAQLAQLTFAYCADFRDSLPYGRLKPVTRAEAEPLRQYRGDGDGYRSQALVALARHNGRHLATAPPRCPMDLRPPPTAEMINATPDGMAVWGSYHFSVAMMVQPAALNAQRPQWTLPNLRPIRLAQIVSPSNKAMAFEYAPFHAPWFDSRAAVNEVRYAKQTVVAADGAAAIRDSSQCTPPVIVSPDLDAFGIEIARIGHVFVFTPNGAAGVDW
jgi:hypothetical protein